MIEVRVDLPDAESHRLPAQREIIARSLENLGERALAGS